MGEGREAEEGGDKYIIIHVVVQRKPTQYCEALFLQLKNKQNILGFSRQEHRSGLPFPSPVHVSEK